MSADLPAAANPANASEAPAEQGFKIFAGNLAYSTDDAALKAFFAPIASDILSVQVIYRGQRSAGYGFVTVSTLAAAEKAVADLNKQELDGRGVLVEIARPHEDRPERPRKSFSKKKVGGRRGSRAVPGEVTEAEADGEYAPAARIDDGADAYADGEAAPKPRKKKSSKKKKVKAAIADVAAAVNPSAANPDNAGVNGTEAETTEGRPKRQKKPRVPRSPRVRGEVPPGSPSTTVLFVANLAFSIDEDALTKVFTDAGIDVKTARVVRRRWGQPRRSKGYGFVDVGDEAEQQKAIAAVHGKEVEGRTLAVKVAVDAPGRVDDEEGGVPAGDAPAAVAPPA